MLAIVELNWKSREAVKNLSREDYNLLRAAVPQIKLNEWPEDKEKPDWYGYGDEVLIDMVEDGPVLARFGIGFEVKNFKNTYKAGKVEHGGASYHLHVAIPNIGLLSIDEVTHVDDACTNVLQSYLDDGWRILAVCPPNAQRRPDYILGRTKE